MGSFFTPGKNEYFWRLAEFLQDENVYVSDKRLIAYTPDQLQPYMDEFPELFQGFPKRMEIYINDIFAAQGFLNDSQGTFVTDVPVPLGQFDLEVRDPDNGGKVERKETYISKNYGLFLDVYAQSLEEQRVAMEQNEADLDYDTIRSGRIFPNVGVYFDFPPPPGWTVDQYRDAVIGRLPDCPGFRRSFFHGGTQKGVVDTIRSITCAPATISSVQQGDRWIVFDRGVIDPTDAADPDAWFVSDADDIPLPNHRALVMSREYLRSAIRVEINGAQRSVISEEIIKATNSFIEGAAKEPFSLNGKNFLFEIDGVSHFTTFAGETTAAQVAAEILVQNPTLTSATYAQAGKLRIGTAPVNGTTKTITIVAGTAVQDLGFVFGQSGDVAPDKLDNPNHVGPVTLVHVGIFYLEGVGFTVDATTGEITWAPSTAAFTTVPAQGASFFATYDYLMKREIEDMIGKAKSVATELELVYL